MPCPHMSYLHPIVLKSHFRHTPPPNETRFMDEPLPDEQGCIFINVNLYKEGVKIRYHF